MQARKFKPNKEIQTIFNQEWKQAKRILKPLLDNTEKPKFYLAKTLKHGWLGYHSGNDGVLMHKVDGRWVRGAHLIVIREDHINSPDFIHTIRHEICHCLEHNHKSRFQYLLNTLVKN